MRIAILVGTSLLFCAGAYGQQARTVGSQITGAVSSVASGDTFRIGFDRIHLWGVDAPASQARCRVGGRKWRPALESVEALRECVRGTTVTCRIQKITPGFARPSFVAECWRDSDKDDVAACMVRSGWATDWPGYSGGYYAALEEEPKATKRGLWQCDAGPPTRRWCWGAGVPCEAIYKPRGPAG